MIKECINITASQDGAHKGALYAVSSAEYPHFIKSEFGQFVLDGDGKSDKSFLQQFPKKPYGYLRYQKIIEKVIAVKYGLKNYDINWAEARKSEKDKIRSIFEKMEPGISSLRKHKKWPAKFQDGEFISFEKYPTIFKIPVQR